jgi:hypothetical protein
MSVTEGTGHVGNTFVEVEVKRAGRKMKSQVAQQQRFLTQDSLALHLSYHFDEL